MLSSNPRLLVGGTHKDGTVNLSLSASSRKKSILCPMTNKPKGSSFTSEYLSKGNYHLYNMALGTRLPFGGLGYIPKLRTKDSNSPSAVKGCWLDCRNWLVLLEHRRSKQESLTHDPWHLSGVVGFCLLKNAEHRRSTPNHAETVR